MIQEYMFVKQVASQSYTTGHPLGKGKLRKTETLLWGQCNHLRIVFFYFQGEALSVNTGTPHTQR